MTMMVALKVVLVTGVDEDGWVVCNHWSGDMDSNGHCNVTSQFSTIVFTKY